MLDTFDLLANRFQFFKDNLRRLFIPQNPFPNSTQFRLKHCQQRLILLTDGIGKHLGDGIGNTLYLGME